MKVYEEEYEIYEQKLEMWELRKAAWKKEMLKSGAQRAPFQEEKPEKPPATRYILNDSTLEKLHAILKENPQGLL